MMPTFIARDHKIRSLYRRGRRIGRAVLFAGAVMFAAYELLWITWVTAVGYDDMTLAQKVHADDHFVPDIIAAFTFGRR